MAFLQWSFPDFLPYRAELYFYPDTDNEGKQWARRHWHTQDPSLTCFIWTLFITSLKKELLQPVMAALGGRKLLQNLDLSSPFILSLWCLRFGFVNLILPSCMCITPPWSCQSAHALAIRIEVNVSPSSGRVGEWHLTIKQSDILEMPVISFYRWFEHVFFSHEELISVSHDDVTNIQLCIYRDTAKSACLSAVPSHSQVPHPSLCVRACGTERDVIYPTDIRL